MAENLVHIEKEKRKTQFKLIVVGDPMIGKTSLIQRYVKAQIPNNYLPTVGSSICKQPVKLNYNGTLLDISLMIWDIAGQEKFNLLHKAYFEGAKGAIIGFDLTNAESFANVRKWRESLAKNNLANIPVVLVGNKSDVAEKICIGQEQVEAMQKELNIPDYYWTSAKNGANVNEMFYCMAYRIYAKLEPTFRNMKDAEPVNGQ
jgi:small GTP-binding protein